MKALALGADMAFVGRATLFGMAAGGEPGVRHAIGILRAEVDRVMALLGCASTRELSPDLLWHQRSFAFRNPGSSACGIVSNALQ